MIITLIKRFETLYSLVHESNQAKPLDAPGAIFLLGSRDSDKDDNLLNRSDLDYLLHTIGKTHHIVLTTLEYGKYLGQLLWRTKQSTGDRRVNILLIYTHGTQDRLLFGSAEEPDAYYEADSVLASDFEALEPNATIILTGCFSGVTLAKKIASVQALRVIAPITNLAAESIVLLCKDTEISMVGCDETGMKNVLTFQKVNDATVEVSSNEEALQIAYQEKIAWLTVHAESGNMYAQYCLGACHEHGFGVPKSLDRAFEWFKKSAELGYVDAEYYLGTCYKQGIKFPASPKDAFTWLARAASKEHTAAMYELGMLFLNGFGVDKSPSLGFHWIKKAAQIGHPQAQHTLGRCYEKGRGCLQSDQKAFECYKEAAKQGFAQAQLDYGYCYEHAIGTEASAKKAFKWYARAAEQGLATAQNAVAFCYETGLGCEQSGQLAFEWYNKAAEQNYPEAIYNVAMCYKKGMGVTSSLVDAIIWLEKEALKDDEDAKREMDLLRKV